jgi:hypothetical protein
MAIDNMSMAPTMMPQPGQEAPQAGMNPNMQAFAEQTGRGGDSVLGHLTPGEIIIPLDAQTEEVLTAVRDAFESAGINPLEFVVGMADNKINPTTGNPEYFLSGLKKKLKKARDKIKKNKMLRTILPIAASMFMPTLAPALMANPLGAAAVNYTANRVVGNDHESSLTGAVISGGLTGAGNMASGSNFMGGGSTGGVNPVTGNNIPASDPMLGNNLGPGVSGPVLSGTATPPISVGDAAYNMFGPSSTAANTVANSTAGGMNASTAINAGASTAGSVTAGAAQDASDEQAELKAKALAEFNKPLELLSEEELAQLLNDPLKRTINRGIYNYE